MVQLFDLPDEIRLNVYSLLFDGSQYYLHQQTPTRRRQRGADPSAHTPPVPISLAMFFVCQRARADRCLEEAFWRGSIISVSTPLEMDQLRTKNIANASCSVRQLRVHPKDHPRVHPKDFTALMRRIPTSFPDLQHLRIMWPSPYFTYVEFADDSTAVLVDMGQRESTKDIVARQIARYGDSKAILSELINDRGVEIYLQLPLVVQLPDPPASSQLPTDRRQQSCVAECNLRDKILQFTQDGRLFQMPQNLKAGRKGEGTSRSHHRKHQSSSFPTASHNDGELFDI